MKTSVERWKQKFERRCNFSARIQSVRNRVRKSSKKNHYVGRTKKNIGRRVDEIKDEITKKKKGKVWHFTDSEDDEKEEKCDDEKEDENKELKDA